MIRKTLILSMGVAAATVSACASLESAPLIVAQADAAPPPVPAALLAPANGKADPPFQVEVALRLAAQMQRESAGPRVVAAPLLTAHSEVRSPPTVPNAPAVVGTSAPTGLAVTEHPSRAVSRGKAGLVLAALAHKAADVGPPAAAAPMKIEQAADLPQEPVRYSDLAKASFAVAAEPSSQGGGGSAAGRSDAAAGAPMRARTARRRLTANQSRWSPARPQVEISRAALAHPAVRAAAPSRVTRVRSVRSDARAATPIFVRIRDVIATWLHSISA